MSATSASIHLRDTTRAAHQALEDALDWRHTTATLPAYRRLLERLYGFHRAWEPSIESALADPAFVEPRRRTHLLQADLAALGQMECGSLPTCPLPSLADAATAMGAMYVVEGSTLGGQVVARHVQASLGLAGPGVAYYHGHGADTGRLWRAFRDRLDQAHETTGRDALVRSANATFALLQDWLVATPGRSRSDAPCP